MVNESLLARLQIEGPIYKLNELLAIIEKVTTQHSGVSSSVQPATKPVYDNNDWSVEPDQPITENQAKRLYAIAQSNGYGLEEMNGILKEDYGYLSTWAIRAKDYATICVRFSKRA